jgi:hypothetical protein
MSFSVVCSNNVAVKVRREYVEQMSVLKDQLANTQGDTLCAPGVSSDMMTCVLVFFETPDEAAFASFLETIDTLTLLEVANYLSCQTLVEAVAKHIASVIAGKTRAEIQSHYGLENVFTAEEERKIFEAVEEIECD